eukprot:1137182-Pelagomonas_calceolata.AAC.4
MAVVDQVMQRTCPSEKHNNTSPHHATQVQVRELMAVVDQVMQRMREMYSADHHIGDMALGSANVRDCVHSLCLDESIGRANSKRQRHGQRMVNAFFPPPGIPASCF